MIDTGGTYGNGLGFGYGATHYKYGGFGDGMHTGDSYGNGYGCGRQFHDNSHSSGNGNGAGYDAGFGNGSGEVHGNGEGYGIDYCTVFIRSVVPRAFEDQSIINLVAFHTYL